MNAPKSGTVQEPQGPDNANNPNVNHDDVNHGNINHNNHNAKSNGNVQTQRIEDIQHRQRSAERKDEESSEDDPILGLSQSPMEVPKMCSHWVQKGWCGYDEKCKFTHPDRFDAKYFLCQNREFKETGQCGKKKCSYTHDRKDIPCKDHYEGKCIRNPCCFSHDWTLQRYQQWARTSEKRQRLWELSDKLEIVQKVMEDGRRAKARQLNRSTVEQLLESKEVHRMDIQRNVSNEPIAETTNKSVAVLSPSKKDMTRATLRGMGFDHNHIENVMNKVEGDIDMDTAIEVLLSQQEEMETTNTNGANPRNPVDAQQDIEDGKSSELEQHDTSDRKMQEDQEYKEGDIILVVSSILVGSSRADRIFKAKVLRPPLHNAYNEIMYFVHYLNLQEMADEWISTENCYQNTQDNIQKLKGQGLKMAEEDAGHGESTSNAMETELTEEERNAENRPLQRKKKSEESVEAKDSESPIKVENNVGFTVPPSYLAGSVIDLTSD